MQRVLLVIGLAGGLVTLVTFATGSSFPELLLSYRAGELHGVAGRAFSLADRFGLLSSTVTRLLRILVLVAGWLVLWRIIKPDLDARSIGLLGRTFAAGTITVLMSVAAAVLFDVPGLTARLLGTSVKPIEQSGPVRTSTPQYRPKLHSESFAGSTSDDVVMVTLDAERIAFSVVGSRQTGTLGTSVADGMEVQGAVAVISGPFASSLQPLVPAGLLRIDGLQLGGSATVAPLSAAVTVHRGRLLLLNPLDSVVLEAEGAFQAGPWIVERGKIEIAKSEPQLRPPYTRAFLGICGGRVVMGVTRRVTSLFNLGQLLLADHHNRPPCESVVNLSGGGFEGLAYQDSLGWGAIGDTTRLHTAVLVAVLRGSDGAP